MTEKLLNPAEPQKDSSDRMADYAEVALRDLYEMGSKWGDRLDKRPHIVMFDPNTFGVSSDLRITSNTKEEDRRLILRRESNEIMTWMPFAQKSEFAFFFLSPGQEERESPLGIPYIIKKPEIFVAYDTSIPLVESFDLFVRLGKSGIANGLIDKSLTIQDNPKRGLIEPQKHDVARYFGKAGSKIAILPGDDIKELLAEFDNPDELEIVNDPETNEPLFISHKKWREYHKKHFEVVQETMEQHGLNRLYLLQLTSQDPKVFGPLLLSVMSEAEEKFNLVWESNK